MKIEKLALLVLLVLIGASCNQRNPNLTETGKDELKALEVDEPISLEAVEYRDVVYVPIYSDIYLDFNNQKHLLAATLSIRNTSYTDSLFISKIDYFNTEGGLVRSYLKNQISLQPMATVNYVIKRQDDSGGTGANFIVKLSARNDKVKPLIQAVMVGQYGNKGFAFSTDGYSIME